MYVFEVLGFKDNETGMATYDDMIKSPDYFANAKRRKHGIQMMTPDEYIEKAVAGFKKSDQEVTRDRVINSRDTTIIDEYAAQMKAGDKFPTIMLDYSMGFSQEGLHRALAAKKIGLTKIPVMVISTTKRRDRGNRRATY